MASWFVPPALYQAGFHACAMNVLPAGTRIEIVNDQNGRSSSCVIIRTGPFYGGRILDVSPSVANELGFYHTGLARVRVYRVVGHVPRCKLLPRPQFCKTPPTACVLDLPKPAILRCS